MGVPVAGVVGATVMVMPSREINAVLVCAQKPVAPVAERVRQLQVMVFDPLGFPASTTTVGVDDKKENPPIQVTVQLPEASVVTLIRITP